MSRPRFAGRVRGRRALTLAFAPRLILQLSGGCQISSSTKRAPPQVEHSQGKFISVRLQVAPEIHSEAESRLLRDRRQQQRLRALCPPRCARSRDLRCHQHLATPPILLRTALIVRLCPRRNLLHEFGRAKKKRLPVRPPRRSRSRS